MSVNPALVGKTFPPTVPYLVGREKVREFSRAVFARDAGHYELAVAQEAGYDDLVAPPTFATVIQDQALQQLLSLEESGIELSRTIHAEQQFRYSRQIVAGDELTARLEVKGIRAVGGNSLITTDTVITDAQGEHVVTATSVLLVGGGS